MLYLASLNALCTHSSAARRTSAAVSLQNTARMCDNTVVAGAAVAGAVELEAEAVVVAATGRTRARACASERPARVATR